MHQIPAKADGWKNRLLCLMKVYVVFGYIVRETCLIYVSGADNYSITQWIFESPFLSPAIVVTGYALCITGLSFAAGSQYKGNDREAAFRTFIFILIGLAFLQVSFRGISAWNWMIPGMVIWANGWVVWCCYRLSRDFKARIFTCWIWACSIYLIGEVGMQFRSFPDWWKVGSSDPFWRLVHDFPAGDFLQIYWIGNITAGALFFTGLVLAIRQLQSNDLLKPSPNTSAFVALGIVALMVSLAVSVSFFHHPEFLPAAAINGAVCLVSLNACRREKSVAFLCLALASALTIVRTAGLDLHSNWQNPPSGFWLWMFDLLTSLGFIATVIWYAGMVLIVQRISTDRQKRTVV